MKRLLSGLFIVLFTLTQAYGNSEGGEGKDEDPMAVKYFDLFPTLVTNYQRSDGKIGFVSAGVQLQIKGSARLEKVKYHKAALQDAMVWLLRTQTEEQLKSVENRQLITEQAKEIFNKKLLELTKSKDLVNAVLFTKYVWQ